MRLKVFATKGGRGGRLLMLKKYISKFTIDILPSVLATIIGAYIVNHYIVTRPDVPAAAVASTPDSAKAGSKPGAAADVAGIPEAGVKARGVSEKALLEKTASERPAVVDRSAETASTPVESHRVQPASREKAAARAVQASIPAPAEAATAAEEKRDATDLARAAIERLRNSPETQPREVARVPEAPRVSETPKVVSPAAQPLPPPVMVSAPGNDAVNAATGSLAAKPAYSAPQIDDPQRPTPPAEIPSSARPLDLRAEVAELPPRQRTSVADDVLSAAKSVFHAVLPR
jgi:hypothetical protein